MQTKGMGHVEVILAFVLFMGFLVFGLYFFNPLSNDRVLGSSLFYAVDEVMDNTTREILTYGVSLNDSDFVVAQNISFPLSREGIDGEGVYVETSTGIPLRGKYAAGALYVSRNNSEFFYARLGNFITDEGPIPNAAFLEYGSNYTISSSDKKNVVSEALLLGLNQSYYSDYDSVRTSFNLPRRVDFAVEAVIDGENVIRMSRQIPEGFEVVSQIERVEVLRIDGHISFAEINVRVW